jgi:methionyl-tRNA formyltransferase
MKILIAGYYTAPIHAIEMLLGTGCKPSDIALLTYNDLRNQTLLVFAAAQGIEVQTFSCKSNACYGWLQARQFDVLLSLYYRHIIPARVLDLFPQRAVNLHAGRLPEYAGCWSSAWSIINGAMFAGYSWHYMTPEIDAGNLLEWGNVEIRGSDTAYSLYHRVLLEGIQKMERVLHLIRHESDGIRQSELLGERRYYPRAIPFGGYIQPEWDETRIERYIRAMYFPPFKGALLRQPDGSEREILTMEDYREVMRA